LITTGTFKYYDSAYYKIDNFENKSKNFTDHIFKSLGSLDFSREYRSSADSYYDVAALIWYPIGEYEKVIVNCTSAMEDYLLGYNNFTTSLISRMLCT